MSLNNLYQEMIKEHNKNPRNFEVNENATVIIRGRNPLCGDDYWIYVTIKDNVVESCSFHGEGCAISKSSASMMTQQMTGKSIPEAKKVVEDFLTMLVSEDSLDISKKDNLKRLKIFESVKNYPIRVKCATLSWRAFEQAITADAKQEISTE